MYVYRFRTKVRYDALNRPMQMIAPHSDQAGTKFNVIQHTFDEAGLLRRIDAWLALAVEPNAQFDPAAVAPSAVGVANIDYNARGQRLSIAYAPESKTVIRSGVVVSFSR